MLISLVKASANVRSNHSVASIAVPREITFATQGVGVVDLAVDVDQLEDDLRVLLGGVELHQPE